MGRGRLNMPACVTVRVVFWKRSFEFRLRRSADKRMGKRYYVTVLFEDFKSGKSGDVFSKEGQWYTHFPPWPPARPPLR